MGLLDRIFGRNEEKAPEPRVIDVRMDDITGILERHNKETQGEIMEDIHALVEEIMEAKREVLEIVEELNSKDFPEEIKDRVPKPVKTAKPKYTRGMEDAVTSIRVEKGDIPGYRSFHAKTLKTMKAIEKTQVGQGRYVAHSFEEDVLRVGGNLNRLIDTAGRLGEVLSRYDETVKANGEAGQIADSIKGLSIRWERDREIVKEHSDQIEALKSQNLDALKKIEELKASDRYAHIKELERGLIRAHQEMENVRGEVFRKISPLGRLLRKYRKLLDGTKECEGIDSYLKDPAGAFVEGVALMPILDGLDKAISGGHISLKDKEMVKMQHRLKEALGADIDALEKRYTWATESLEATRGEIKMSKIGGEITTLEEGIGKNEGIIKNMEGEIRSLEKDMPGIQEKIEHERRHLQDLMADIMGTRVELTL